MRERVTVGDRVKGFDVAAGEPEREYVGLMEYVIDTVGVNVKGRVVGIPDLVTETVIERVKGSVVGIPEEDLVILCVLVIVTETVGVCVKGCVVGIPDLVNVIVGDFE